MNEIDERVWKAWKRNDRTQDRRLSATCLVVLKYVAIAGLLAMAVSGSQDGILLRSVVTAGAVAVTFQAVAARRYGFAVTFTAIVVLFNPFFPVFRVSGLNLPLVLATVLAFAASLVSLKSKLLRSTRV